MSKLDRHFDEPDTGVISTDLFIYDAAEPGTGALVSVVIPRDLEERKVVFADTTDLQVLFDLDRSANTADVFFVRKGEPPTTDLRTFRMTPEFQTVAKTSLTLLISDWKIISLINGEPLKRLN